MDKGGYPFQAPINYKEKEHMKDSYKDYKEDVLFTEPVGNTQTKGYDFTFNNKTNSQLNTNLNPNSNVNYNNNYYDTNKYQNAKVSIGGNGNGNPSKPNLVIGVQREPYNKDKKQSDIPSPSLSNIPKKDFMDELTENFPGYKYNSGQYLQRHSCYFYIYHNKWWYLSCISMEGK